jgi:hypothetical protein
MHQHLHSGEGLLQPLKGIFHHGLFSKGLQKLPMLFARLYIAYRLSAFRDVLNKSAREACKTKET